MRHTLTIAVATLSLVTLTIPRSAARAAEEISVAAMPPVVVRTVPPSGNTQVDPSTTEIRVTFSKDMTDGNWSWTQISDESFPERNGEVHYMADKRTCVMPVKLKPGRTYLTWLNSERFGNFKDTEGHSAVPYLLVFETADKTPGRPWGPEQATGPPDTRGPGDMQTAWASLTPDDAQEWLLLRYDPPIHAGEVRVYETFNPGALTKVSVFGADGKEIVAWEGKDPTALGSGMGASKISIKVDFAVEQVKLYIDSPKVAGWNEIDAVALVDAEGKENWATSAEASSTFAARMSGEREELEPAAQPIWPAGFKIRENAVKLSYVADASPDKRSLGGTGEATAFDRPEGEKKLVAVQIFASRYGYPQPPDEDFHLYVLDENHKVLKDLPFPYAMIARGAERWYTLAVPGVDVPERFLVALSFNAHQTKGVYLGIDKSVKTSHSFIGLPEEGYKPAGNFDWMIRAWLAGPSDRSQSHNQATAAIAQIETALRLYHLDTGSYPTGEQGLEALRKAPADLAKPADWKGPYLKDAIPLDPWGSPYQYRTPGKDDAHGFELWSFGPDRIDSTDDDVVP